MSCYESLWKRNLFGSVAICFSVYTQNSKWVNAAGIPSTTLTLICLTVLWYSAGQERCHTVMAPCITPPPTRTQASIQWQPERTSGSRATITFEWLCRCSREMQCNIEKSRQMHYKLKSITNHGSQFSETRFWLHFSFFTYSLLFSFSHPSCLSCLSFSFNEPSHTLSRWTMAVDAPTDMRGANQSSKS